jgi:hypothetical protein
MGATQRGRRCQDLAVTHSVQPLAIVTLSLATGFTLPWDRGTNVGNWIFVLFGLLLWVIWLLGLLLMVARRMFSSENGRPKQNLDNRSRARMRGSNSLE